MQTLTQATETIFQWIYSYITANGYSPSGQDIAEGTGYGEHTVHDAVRELVARGWLTKKPNVPRSIALANVPAHYIATPATVETGI